jgi:hypothetical protein
MELSTLNLTYDGEDNRVREIVNGTAQEAASDLTVLLSLASRRRLVASYTWVTYPAGVDR